MRLGKKSILAFIAGIFFVGFVSFGLFISSQKSQGKFGIYLLQNDQLVITDEDMVWYNKTSYQMRLTEDGLSKLEALTVPVHGVPFVAKLSGEEVYNGSFWTPISSVPYNGLVIEILRDNNTIVEIQRGYPSSEFFAGTDPRNNSELLEYFQEIGKLTQ
jgi:hypothetical protein